MTLILLPRATITVKYLRLLQLARIDENHMTQRKIVPVKLTLKASSQLAVLYLLMIALVNISATYLQIPHTLKIIWIVLCTACAVYILYRDVMLAFDYSWQTVEITSAGVLRLHNKQGDMIEPTLLKHTFCHPSLVVLNIQHADLPAKASRSIIITPWQVVDIHQFRALRVWLKWWRAG